jgi:hypothetical protein
MLQAQGDDAYSRYNAPLRELGSFLQAFDSRQSRAPVDRHDIK